MTVYRRPDPIPLHRSRPAVDLGLHAVRAEPEDLHLLVSRQIVAAILSGTYPEGSILPNEEALSRDLGVSRTALRESVKGLVAKGILETKRRRGTLVLGRQRWNLFDADVIGWLRRESAGPVTHDLLGMLAIVVPGAVKLAASARSTGNLADTALSAGDVSLKSRADFLIELAAAANNAFITAIISTTVATLLADESQQFDEWTSWLTVRRAKEMTELIIKGDLSVGTFAPSITSSVIA